MSTPIRKNALISFCASIALASVSQIALAQPAPAPLPPLPSEAPAPPPPAAPPAPPGEGGAPTSQPPTAAPKDTPPPPTDDAEEAKKVRLAVRGAGGYQYWRMNGIPVTAARMRFGVGGQTDFGAHYGSLSILYAGTENGLRTWDFRFGWIGDFLRYGPVRLGVDAEVGYLVVRRTSVDDRFWALGAGGGVHAAVDVLAFGPRDDHAITVEGHFDGHLHFGTAFVWGPNLLVGFRY